MKLSYNPKTQNYIVSDVRTGLKIVTKDQVEAIRWFGLIEEPESKEPTDNDGDLSDLDSLIE